MRGKFTYSPEALGHWLILSQATVLVEMRTS